MAKVKLLDWDEYRDVHKKKSGLVAGTLWLNTQGYTGWFHKRSNTLFLPIRFAEMICTLLFNKDDQ